MFGECAIIKLFSICFAKIVLDATAKWNAGFMMGNIKSLGHFDQCVNIATDDTQIHGQYCTANIDTSLQDVRLIELLDKATLGRRDREMTINRTSTPVRVIFRPTTARKIAFCPWWDRKFNYYSACFQVPDLLPSMSLIQFGLCTPASCSAKDVESLFNSFLSSGVAEIESCYTKEPFAPRQREIAFM
jgi:Nose resistant-to-fluoxetine protein, N-terminal domain